MLKFDVSMETFNNIGMVTFFDVSMLIFDVSMLIFDDVSVLIFKNPISQSTAVLQHHNRRY